MGLLAVTDTSIAGVEKTGGDFGEDSLKKRCPSDSEKYDEEDADSVAELSTDIKNRRGRK